MEAQPRLHIRRRPQPQQRQAAPDGKHLLEMGERVEDVAARRPQGGVAQQRAHDPPVRLVVGGGRQAGAPVVVPIREVETVEPVTRVVAVAVE